MDGLLTLTLTLTLGSRLQWMGYYMQPEVAQWEEALALAVTPEEEEQVAAAKAGIAYEEEKRTKWFHFYLSNSNFDKARSHSPMAP